MLYDVRNYNFWKILNVAVIFSPLKKCLVYSYTTPYTNGSNKTTVTREPEKCRK